MIKSIIFYVLAFITIASAIGVVTVKNVFHAALLLIVSVLGVSGFYAMLAADFLFAVQLLVYGGGIMVLLLFIVLLSGKPADWTGVQINEKAWLAGLGATLVATVVGVTLLKWDLPSVESVPQPTTANLGTLLLTDMVLPFEIISLVLVAALIGAVYFSAKKPS